MLNAVPAAGVLNFVIPALSAGPRKTFAWAKLVPMVSKTKVRQVLIAGDRVRPVRNAPKIQIATIAILVQMIAVLAGPAKMPTIPTPAMTAMQEHAMMSALTELVPAGPAAAAYALMIADGMRARPEAHAGPTQGRMITGFPAQRSAV